MGYIRTSFKYAVVSSVALYYGIITIIGLSFRLLIHPLTPFWRVKQRDEYPQILKDAALGHHKYIKIRDVRLHYVENGDNNKPLMLFLHGFPDFWFSWRNQIREFSQEYWTVAVDMRGYGESDKPVGAGNYTINKLTQDVKELIKALGKDKCILVAHDWGGLVGHTFIRRYPEMVEKYILLNTAHVTPWKRGMFTSFTQFFKSWYVFFFQLPYLPEFALRANDLSFLHRMNRKHSTEDEIEAYKYMFRKFGHLTGPINYYRSVFTASPKELTSNRLNELNVPGLYIHGENDIALTKQVCYAQSFKDIKNVKYVIVKDADHFVHLSAPKQVNETMSNFLSGKEVNGTAVSSNS